MANSHTVQVRPYEPRDREAVREICRRTGLKGDPTFRFFEDTGVLVAIYADYYLDHEPDNCFVAEIDGKIVGYQLACRDTARRQRVMRTRIYPRLAARVAFRALTGWYRKKETYRTIWWLLSRSWKEGFEIPVVRYPGHGHSNVDEAHRSCGVGLALSNEVARRMAQKGAQGTHMIIREPEGEEQLSRFYLEKRNYRLAAVKRFTLWDEPTGKKWYARLLVRDPDEIPEV